MTVEHAGNVKVQRNSYAINTAAYYQRVTTCGSCGTVVRRRRIDNTWPVVALQHAATRYRLRIAISAYPTCIRRLH